jgi:hypothetical protein
VNGGALPLEALSKMFTKLQKDPTLLGQFAGFALSSAESFSSTGKAQY